MAMRAMLAPSAMIRVFVVIQNVLLVDILFTGRHENQPGRAKVRHVGGITGVAGVLRKSILGRGGRSDKDGARTDCQLPNALDDLLAAED
jgi:hypothetical protein